MRRDILSVLRRRGASPISEIAGELGVRAGSLYYHVRALRALGLTRDAGTRPGTTRPEQLHAAVDEPLVIGSDAGPVRRRRAIAALHDADLQETRRRVHAALRLDEGADALPASFTVRRLAVRLGADGRAAVERALSDVVALALEHEDPDGDLEALLLVRVPTSDRANGVHRR